MRAKLHKDDWTLMSMGYVACPAMPIKGVTSRRGGLGRWGNGRSAAGAL